MVETILSQQALDWQEYFLKVGITPQEFLEQYPNTKYKKFINEILNSK